MPAQTAPSLSICFPCFNDAGTIGSLVASGMAVARGLTDRYEVIVVNDGSSDASGTVLAELARVYPHLTVITHPKNLGYGAALRSAFGHATMDFLFYTDGDGQYDVMELTRLWSHLNDGVSVVNGYKVSRADPFYRLLVGWCYNGFNKALFRIHLRDIDCDFRLIRRDLLQKLDLKADGGEICVEMVRKWEQLGAKVVEVPVSHYHRVLGRSQFFRPSNVVQALRGVLGLRLRLR